MSGSRRFAVLLTALFITMLGLTAPAYAQSYKSQSACGGSPQLHVTVRYRVSAGHFMDISERMCTNGSGIKWATNPNISYPSVRFSPIAPEESISTGNKPTIYSFGSTLNGLPKRITWRYTVNFKTLKLLTAVTRIFYFRVYPAYAEVCQSGHHDKYHCARNTWKRG
jgi:hypothetical protein